MRRFFYVLFMLIAFLPLLNLMAQTQQESSNFEYVTQFKMDEMAKIELADFELVRKRPWGLEGMEYVYQTPDRQRTLFITVGLHSSYDKARETLTNYLNYASIAMEELSESERSMGDKMWVWPSNNADEITNLIFIRKNALFRLSAHDKFVNIGHIAKAIDDGIMQNAAFVTTGNTISVPIIRSIKTNQIDLHDGKGIKIIIDAFDPQGEEIVFHSDQGLIEKQNGPSNVLIYFVNQEGFGGSLYEENTFQIIVINESNVVSEIATLNINN